MQGTSAQQVLKKTIAGNLRNCTCLKSLKQSHAQIVATGLHSDNYLAVKLVSAGKLLGYIAYAREVFDSLAHSANLFLWTAIISVYAQFQTPNTVEAVLIYARMHKCGKAPNSFTLSSVLKACSFLLAIREGRQIHAQAYVLGLAATTYVRTTLIDMYAKFGCIEAATHLFEMMSEPNVVACNAMIACNSKAGMLGLAHQIFDGMHERDSISWTAMISGYANGGNMRAAQDLFNMMSDRGVASWNALITGYSHSGQWDEALRLFDEMQQEYVRPDEVTMAVVFTVCGQLGALERGKTLHEYLKKIKLIKDIHVYNSLLDMYAKCGELGMAYKVFCEMPTKDIVSYNVMIMNFAHHGDGEKAFKLFEELVTGGFKPDKITFLGVLTASSHAGLVEVGQNYFISMIHEFSMEPTVDHYACMVDLLGRAGLVEEAYQLVKTMRVEPHAGVWGALLNACRTHCNVQVGEIAAQKLFVIEPHNPGNYVLLSNIYARAGMWSDVTEVRSLMRGKKVSKTAGSSWIEVDNKVHLFLIGDKNHSRCIGIYSVLRHLTHQLETAISYPDISLGSLM